MEEWSMVADMLSQWPPLPNYTSASLQRKHHLCTFYREGGGGPDR